MVFGKIGLQGTHSLHAEIGNSGLLRSVTVVKTADVHILEKKKDVKFKICLQMINQKYIQQTCVLEHSS